MSVINQTLISSSGTDVISAASTGKTKYSVNLMLCNNDSDNDEVLNIYVLVDTGSGYPSVGDGNRIFKNVAIAAEDTLVLNIEKMFFGENAKLHIVSTLNNKTSATAFFVES